MEKPKNLSGKLWRLYVVILICSFVFVDLGFAKDSREEKGYTYSLEELSRKVEKKIEKVNKKLEKRKAEERNMERELEARKYFEEGDRLSEEGKDEKAKEAWQKALEITKNPEMKGCVEESKKRARAEKKKVELEKELAFKKEKALKKEKEKAERERQRKLKTEQKEKKRSEERLEKKRLREEELAKEKKERAEKEEQKRLEVQRKKAELEKERALNAEKKAKEKADLKQKRWLKAKQKEKERLEKKRLREEESAKEKKERAEKEEQKRLKAEEKKKAKEAILAAKKVSEDVVIETSLKLENLPYKSEKDCLAVLSKNPEDKEAYDSLVNLYVLKDELLDKSKKLYNNKNYQGAIKEYNKVLLIEPENKKAKTEIKRARSRMK